MSEPFVFSERWHDLRGYGADEAAARDRLETELRRELADGHVLFGTPATAIAACGHCDDVLYEIPGDRFARVHLSYPNSGPDRPPWPGTDLFEEWPAAVAYVIDHEDE